MQDPVVLGRAGRRIDDIDPVDLGHGDGVERGRDHVLRPADEGDELAGDILLAAAETGVGGDADDREPEAGRDPQDLGIVDHFVGDDILALDRAGSGQSVQHVLPGQEDGIQREGEM